MILDLKLHAALFSLTRNTICKVCQSYKIDTCLEVRIPLRKYSSTVFSNFSSPFLVLEQALLTS